MSDNKPCDEQVIEMETLEENLTMYTVKVLPDGEAQVVGQQPVTSSVKAPRVGRVTKYKSPDGTVLAVGKVVNVTESPVVSADGGSSPFQQRPFSTADKSELFKILKMNKEKGGEKPGQTPPVILFCSLCGHHCQNVAEMRHHCALVHPRYSLSSLKKG